MRKHMTCYLPNGYIRGINFLTRIILTFETTHQVLAAEKAIKAGDESWRIRPTPTPPHLSTSVCGMSLELLDHAVRNAVIDHLAASCLEPAGVFELE